MNKKTIFLIVAAFIFGGLLVDLFVGRVNILALFPYAIFLICPLMMLFMMGGKNHKH